jgi:hypothetical protein
VSSANWAVERDYNNCDADDNCPLKCDRGAAGTCEDEASATFSVTQHDPDQHSANNPSTVTVHRTDSDNHWDLDLKIWCHYGSAGGEQVELLSAPLKKSNMTRRAGNPKHSLNELQKKLNQKMQILKTKYPDPEDRRKAVRAMFVFKVDRKKKNVEIAFKTNKTHVSTNSTQLLQSKTEWGAIGDAVQWVGDTAGDAWDWIEDTYDDATTWVENTVTAIANAVCDGFEFNVWDIIMGIGGALDTLDVFNVKDLVAEAITAVLDAIGLSPANFMPNPDLGLFDVELPDPPQFTFDFTAVATDGANFLDFNWPHVDWESNLLMRMATEQDFTCGTSGCAQV